MIYLSGCIRNDLPQGVGCMTTPWIGNKLPEDRVFATDTGCFAKPESHDDEKYLAWLSKLPLDRCLFATAPDRFGDGHETLRVAMPMLPRIRALGVRAAIVLQPGVTDLPWDEFDCLFLGGPNPWQQSDQAHRLVARAQELDKWTHRGRVNSESRILASMAMGFDSCDGTLIAFGPEVHKPRVAKWMQRAEMQRVLI